MAEHQLTHDALDPLAGMQAQQGISQMADILQKQLGMSIRVADDGLSFDSGASPAPRRGIIAVRGQAGADQLMVLQLELARVPAQLRIPASVLGLLGELGDKCRLVKPASAPADGCVGLCVEMRGAAAPMSMARESGLVSELDRLGALAQAVQEEIPAPPSPADLQKLYEKFADHLDPTLPLDDRQAQALPGVMEWAAHTLDFVQGWASVAIESSFAAPLRLAMAALAKAAGDAGRTLAQVTAPTVNSKALVEIARRAPGIVWAPAIRVSLGSSAYEMANEIACLLASLTAAGTPVIFTGSQEQLQQVFGGGQGGGSDPLCPVLRHVPDVEMSALLKFAIDAGGRAAGGLSASAEKEVTRAVTGALKDRSPAEQRRLLPLLAARAVSALSKNGKVSAPALREYAARLGSQNETLAGLAPRPRAGRPAEVQDRFAAVMTDRGLADYLMEPLLSQEAAIAQLVELLRTECLTRPLHQPYRYCAQGTPGTGKSESAILLAQRLDVPYINIDAASMPDSYSAAAQLLGSGRGIVGSYQSGRLEQVAKHHRGAVVEVSDLDHATPAVRASLADLFLQVLETGEGQSATGAMFSCASLVFAFTMNLPDGMDESVRKRIGFKDGVQRRDVTADVAQHIKRMLSGAFLSRVGTPIVFQPLDGAALASIVERAARAAVRSAAERLHVEIQDVTLEEGLGARAVAVLEANVTSFGARALLEHGRRLASSAFLELAQSGIPIAGRALRIAFLPDGKMEVRPEKQGR